MGEGLGYLQMKVGVQLKKCLDIMYVCLIKGLALVTLMLDVDESATMMNDKI
jgi:hypothetical protein